MRTGCRWRWAAAALAVLLLAAPGPARLRAQDDLDPAARRWVEETLGRMTLDEKVGQLVTPSLRSVYTSSDSAVHDDLTVLVREHRVGGVHVFGARRARPDVLLNPTYSRTALGQPLAAASLLNRLLHRGARVDLDALPEVVGTRAHRAVAREVSERSVTLIRDAAGNVPLRTPRGGSLLCSRRCAMCPRVRAFGSY